MDKKYSVLFFITVFAIIIPEILFCQNNLIDNILGIVGNQVILYSDVENQYYQTKDKENFHGTSIRCDIFENLLLQKLLLNQSQLDSLEVSEKEVDQQLDRRLRYFVSQVGSEKALEEYFNKSITDIRTDLRKSLKEQMLIEKEQNKLTGDMKVTPTEVREFYKNIPKDSIPTVTAQIELEQIAMYPVILPQQVIEVKAKLQELRERILKGESFATLAIMYSEDVGSASKGGELGFVGRSELVPEFASVAFNLKENEVSKIVETPFGYHIIQLIARKGEQINVRHILLMPKVSPNEIIKTKKTLDSLNLAIRAGKLSFYDAVDKYSQDESSRNNNGLMVNVQTGGTKFDFDALDAPTKYAISDLNVGDISNIIETKNVQTKTVYKIVRLKSKSKTHKANLKDDYQMIQELALQNKKQQSTDDWIKEKQSSVYIHIDDSYKKCHFQSKGWIR